MLKTSLTALSVPQAAWLLPLLLAGCGGDASPTQFAPPCPQVSLLDDAADVTRYRPTGHDISDMVLHGRITGVSGKCMAGDPGKLNAQLAVSLQLTRGPAAAGSTARAAYFVAVTRGNTILQKQVYPVGADFKPNVDTVNVIGDEVDLALPVSKTLSGAAYTILVGFQLSPEELAQNRDHASR